ncbi:protoheme IX farnesyltransferase [Marivirga sp. S37H4]|uniref:Protoheme IX farnesyltransferase n=1 Tax=Marivirga aurantiaca TaxID=2802615 RepID=A0A934WVI2_9BACT|nr:heme o synthase [Marivirga aurantiaca]MBK6263719.1 protoheme IX farnesyltransferase [Marivirga aurantiaca]
MQYPETQSLGISEILSTYLKGFYTLLKPRLSFLVAFSSAFGYVLGFSGGSINWMVLTFLAFGGFLVSGSAVTINQIIEVEHDKKMDRTKNRPLPTGMISKNEAILFAIITGIAGLGLLLVFTNLLTTLLSLLSLLLYSFVYTPLKRVGPIAVFAGAIPGALPPLLGWVAATNGFSVEAWIIFGIQFIWQFPHFWAIAWVADEDYKKAGFKLLPSGGQKDLNTAIQIMIYTLFLIPLGLLPTLFGITGVTSALVATICGVLFLSQTFYLMKECSKEAALKIMFGSFLYLPIVQVAYLLDKI